MSAPTTTNYTYYHGGPLFTLADLHTNTLLAQRISTLSSARFTPILPQDLEHRDTSPHSIRDQDIRGLLSCDLALFTYDGAELDAGTVVEYMIAKFADIPAVILRTDFRKAGDQGGGDGDPWNLMSSFWPRTRRVVVDAMAGYKAGLAGAMEQSGDVEGVASSGIGGGRAAIRAGEVLLEETARRVVEAIEEVVGVPAVMPRELRGPVYEWIARMPGFRSALADGDERDVVAMRELLEGKERKGLM